MRNTQPTEHHPNRLMGKINKTTNPPPQKTPQKPLPIRVIYQLNTELKPDCSVLHTAGEMLDQQRQRRPAPSFQEPLAVPLINNTSWKLSCMSGTITAPNLVQSQLGLWLDIIRPCLLHSQHIWATGLWRACPKLWSRTIAIRWNNASINSASNWRQYVGFQVEIQKKRGSGCSVPTPALPGANSHWISGESRGGEQTAPLLKWHEKWSQIIRVR